MAGYGVSAEADFKQGEMDGRRDGGAGAKPLSAELLKRHYSLAYANGYREGYAKASEPHRLRREAKL